MEYRIIESSYCNEYGKEVTKHYYIEVRKSFLGIDYWCSIKHKTCDETGCFKVKTTFDTYEEAYRFIKDVLSLNKKKDTWVDKIIEYVSI